MRKQWISLALILAHGGLLNAATDTWNGSSGNGQMNTAANWNPASVPANGDTLIFPGGVSAADMAVNNNIQVGVGNDGLLVGGLTITGAYILTGSPFEFPSSVTVSYGGSGSNLKMSSSTAGVGGIVVDSGATLSLSSNASGNTITSIISGSGNLAVTGGLITLVGANTYTGTTTIGVQGVSSGILAANGAGNFSPSSNVTINSGSTLEFVSGGLNTIGTLSGVDAGSMISLGTGTLTVTNSGTSTFPGTITGTNGGFALSGTGSLTLSGNNSYSTTAAPGSTSVNSGTLIAGSVNAFGSGGSHITISSGATMDLSGLGSSTLSFGSLAGAGTLNLGGTSASFSAGGTFSGLIEGAGGSVIVTAATLTLSGTNTFTGTTQIQGGVLVVNGTAIQDTTGLVFSSGGGTLQTTANLTLGSTVPVTMNANGIINIGSNTVVLGGNISGTSNLTMQGTTGTLTLNGTNSGYSGVTSIYGGTLLAGSATALGNMSSFLLADSGTLNLNGNSSTIGSLAGAVGTTVNLGSSTLTINNGSVNDALFGTMIGSGGNLVVSGGTVTLMNPNTFTGTTTIQGGAALNTYSLGTSSSLIFSTGGGNLEFGSSSTFAGGLVINGPATIGANTYEVTLSGNFSNSGTAQSFTKVGPGTLTLTGSMVANPVTQITISGGTLNATAAALGTTAGTPPPIVFVTFGGTLQAGAAMTIPQAITLSNAGTIDTNGHAVTVSGAIGGSYGLTKAGTNTLTLTGSNNYGGKTQVFDGTLNATSSSFSTASTQLVFGGTGTPIFQAGSAFSNFTPSVVLMNNGTFDTNSNNMTISGIIASGLVNGVSPYSLIKADSSGTATLILSGANIYTGPTVVNVGTLQAGIVSTATSGAFGVGSAVTVSSAATLALNSFSNTIGSLAGAAGSFVTLGTGTLTISNGNSQTFGGNISGAGGGLTLTTGILTLSGTNSYTGATTLSGGTLTAGSTSAFAPGSAFTVAGGATLNLNNNNNTVGSLSGPTGGFVTLGSGRLTVANGSSQTFAGNISGTGGGLTLTTGTLTLSGSNSYTGGTTINGGILQAGSTSAFSSGSAVTIASGGTLSLNNFNNSILSLAGPSGSAVTLGSGILTIGNGNSLTFSGNFGTGTGGLTLTTGALTLAGTNSYSGLTTVSSGATLTFGTNTNSLGSLTNSGTVATATEVSVANYTQNSAASLNLTLPVGTNPANLATYGNIHATGTINLNGALALNTSSYVPGSGTTIILLQSTAASQKALQGAFSSTSVPAGYTLRYDYNMNQVYVVTGDPSQTCQGIWAHPTSGNWGDPTNWAGGTCAPGVSQTASNLDTATFNDVAGTSVFVPLATSGGMGPTDQSVTLFSITFDAPSTAYTIQQYGDLGAITLSNVDTNPFNPIPNISVSAGTHTIDVPIILAAANGSCQFNISTSELILGSSGSITSQSTNSLFITEGQATGILTNQGSIAPDNLFILGGTINNYNAISPVEGIAIAGLSGNSSPLIVNNYATMTSGTGGNFSITGLNSPTSMNNYGRVTPASGTTFFITSSTVTNNSGATLGSSDSNLVFSSGTLATSGQVLANDYDQSDAAILQINVLDASNSGNVAISGEGSLAGALVVNALPGFSGSSPQTITLLTSTGGFQSAFSSSSFENFPSSVIPEVISLPNEIQLSTTLVAHTHFSSGAQVLFSAINQHNTYITRKCYQLRSRFSRGSKKETTQVSMESKDSSEEQLIAVETISKKLPRGLKNAFQKRSRKLRTTSEDPIVFSLASNDLSKGRLKKFFEEEPLDSEVVSEEPVITEMATTEKQPEAQEKQELPLAAEILSKEPVTSEMATLETHPGIQPKQELPITLEVLSEELVISEMTTNHPEIQAKQELPAVLGPLSEEHVIREMVAQGGGEVQIKQEQLARRIAEEEPKPWNIYSGPVATFGHIDTVDSQVGLGHFSVGGLLGFDYILPKSEKGKVEAGLGALVEFRKEWGTALENAGSITSERVHGSLYGTILPADLPELYFDWVLGFAYAWDHLTRNTGIGSQLQAKSSPNEVVYDALAGVEYRIGVVKGFSITPLVHIQYANDHIGSYRESGAGIYDLNVDSQVVQSLSTSLGARFDYLFSYSNFSLLAEVDAEWQREYLNKNRAVYFTPFNITDESTSVSAIGAPRNGALVALDLLATFADGWQIEANGTLQWNSLLYDAFFYLGFGKTF